MSKLLKFILVIIYVGMITSCSTEKNILDIEEPDKKHSVNFSFSLLSSEISTYKLKASDTPIKSFYLYIYDENEKLYTHFEKSMINSAEELNNIQIELPEGNYTAVALAFDESIDGYEIENPLTIGSTPVLPLSQGHFHISKKLLENTPGSSFNFFDKDYFFKNEKFTVSNNTTVNLKLSRITGRIEINFTDIEDTFVNNIADNTPFVGISMSNIPTGIKFNGGYVYYGSPIFYLTYGEWKKFKDNPFIINARGGENITLSVNFIDSQKINPSGMGYEVISSYKFENLIIYKNKINRLTGPIINKTGFAPELDQEWDEIIEGGL